MSQQTVLIVEDDPDILELLQYNLQRDGFRTIVARTGEDGIRVASAEQPDLILLDLMLPGMQGLEVCRLLRERPRTRATPIIMVTAKGEESDVVLGLERGADDYVIKPFGPKELIARIQAVLRRSRQGDEAPPAVVRRNRVEVDSTRHEVRLDGRPVELTLAEFRLLRALAAHPGQVFTRAQLLEHVTGGEHVVIERNVDVHVATLRKKLHEVRDSIQTVRGIGYKWKDDEP
ncbi:MAG: response regulator [Thermoanaerobaculia bacterium]